MRESELLGHIYARSADLSRQFPEVIAGPGHDCAVVRIGSEAVLLKVDQLVRGRHFRADAPLDLIARKAVARAVSDIAASGGTPVCGLCAAALPADYSDANELFDAVSRWAIHFGCPLVGGDITSSAELSLSISIVGRPHPARGPVLRSGAAVGDGVYVTGSLGGSFDAATGLGHHFTFEPRLAEARALCDELGPRLHAMMDISDGLGRDAGRLAAASGVRIELEASHLPFRDGATWRQAISDGEDYQLLFAAAGAVPTLIGQTPVTRIGTVTSGRGVHLRLEGDELRDISGAGWEHGA